jgi:glutamate 5-kinase
MATKITAAEIASAAGVRTAITEGRFPENIAKILAGEPLGTQFAAQTNPINARKRWIAHALVPVGKLFLDDGAVKAVIHQGKSLLAAGIRQIEGEFQAEDAVQLCRLSGEEIARGLVNYTSGELQKIQGYRSEDIPQILGYPGAETVVHRDNMVLSS